MVKSGFSPYENRHRRGPRRFCPQGATAAEARGRRPRGGRFRPRHRRSRAIIRISRSRWRATWRRAARDRGILVCSTGIGMAMAANKVAGVRAAPAQSEDEVRLTREHNDANVLTLGARYLDEEHAADLIRHFPEHRICRRPARAPGGQDRAVGKVPDARSRRQIERRTLNRRNSMTADRNGAASGRSRSRSLRGHPARGGAPALAARADRQRELHLRSGAGSHRPASSPTSTPKAIPASATTAAANSPTSWRTWRATAPRSCSAPSTPTCSRTPARRPTRRPMPRCSRPATPSWG